ncbi:MAG: hypothetical protein KDC38_03500, partial [Planctomycetes bacterium]|nr:hypothetical protein [Planctomycetota bacterium]
PLVSGANPSLAVAVGSLTPATAGARADGRIVFPATTGGGVSTGVEVAGVAASITPSFSLYYDTGSWSGWFGWGLGFAPYSRCWTRCWSPIRPCYSYYSAYCWPRWSYWRPYDCHYFYRTYCYPRFLYCYTPFWFDYSYYDRSDYYDGFVAGFGLAASNPKPLDLEPGEREFCDGWRAMRDGRFEEAAVAFGRSREHVGRRGVVGFFEAVALAGVGDIEAAAAQFESAIRAQPSLVLYEWDAAAHLGSEARLDELVRSIIESDRVAADAASRWVCLAAIHRMSGRDDDARRAAGGVLFSGAESEVAERVLAELTRRDEGEPLEDSAGYDPAVARWLLTPSCERIPRLRLPESPMF